MTLKEIVFQCLSKVTGSFRSKLDWQTSRYSGRIWWDSYGKAKKAIRRSVSRGKVSHTSLDTTSCSILLWKNRLSR